MTMQVSQALEILGTRRVIWIDDRFQKTPAQLAELLTNGLEIAQACEFLELEKALATYEIDAAEAVQTITQILTDLSGERVEAIRDAFFSREKADKGFPTNELSADAITSARQLLGVAANDCWTFEQAERGLPGLCETGDAHLSYIVDLNESGGSPTRGLSILRRLWDLKSRGTAFILTHETTVAEEAQKERELGKLNDPDGLGLPLCVIAKERLSDKVGDEEGMADALRVCLKRAGLRRSMHEVLSSARERLRKAIDTAALNLLMVPPEQLETHIFERGYKEGVSELHVVERAITAHVGKEVRAFFGIDEDVQASNLRLRALRAIPLRTAAVEPEPHLAEFREAEVWESDDLLNRALTPIACGDVFELDPIENANKSSKRKFILLGQPCDLSLRPEGRPPRALDTAFLVPLKIKTQPVRVDPKAPLLPFILRDEQWACDFRNASVVCLSILDLASFRRDGRVRVDDGHTPPPGLLVAQHKVYADRTKEVSAAMADPKLRPQNGLVMPGLQLAFTSSGPFKHIHSPVFEESSEQKVNGETIFHPKRGTWRLRRCGRVRMPYASALLDQYTSVMSRQAFDLDFMSPTVEASASERRGVAEGVDAEVVVSVTGQTADVPAEATPPQGIDLKGK